MVALADGQQSAEGPVEVIEFVLIFIALLLWYGAIALHLYLTRDKER